MRPCFADPPLSLTESWLGNRFESTRDDSKDEHVLEVFRTTLGDEEGTPEEDLVLDVMTKVDRPELTLIPRYLDKGNLAIKRLPGSAQSSQPT